MNDSYIKGYLCKLRHQLLILFFYLYIFYCFCNLFRWYRNYGEKTKRQKRILAEQNLDEDVDITLFNDEGKSIEKLEESLHHSHSILGPSGTILNRSEGGQAAPALLLFLIEKTIVNNVQDMPRLFFDYQCSVVNNIRSAKDSTTEKIKLVSERIKKTARSFIFYLDLETKNKLRLLYSRLKSHLLIDEIRLYNALHTLEYSTEGIPIDKNELKVLEQCWEKLKNQKPVLKSLIMDARQLLCVYQAAILNNFSWFPLSFILWDVHYEGDRSARELVVSVDTMMHHLITKDTLREAYTMYFVNTNKLSTVQGALANALIKLNELIQSNSSKLLKYLYHVEKGPLRAILALFQFILKREVTMHKNSFESEGLFGHLRFYNTGLNKYYLNLLHEEEKNLLEEREKEFKNIIYFFFKINMKNTRWNALNRRLAYSERLDIILKTLNEVVTLVFFKSYLGKLENLINELQDKIDDSIRRQRIASKCEQYTPTLVGVSHKFFLKIHSLYFAGRLMFTNTMSIVRLRLDAIDYRIQMIKYVNTLNRILNLIRLFERMEGEMKQVIGKLKSAAELEHKVKYLSETEMGSTSGSEFVTKSAYEFKLNYATAPGFCLEVVKQEEKQEEKKKQQNEIDGNLRKIKTLEANGVETEAKLKFLDKKNNIRQEAFYLLVYILHRFF